MQKKIFLFLFFSFLFSRANSFAYEQKVTHPLLSELAAKNSILEISKGNYLQHIGFLRALEEPLQRNTVLQWIKDGAKAEDDTPRFLNHFHKATENFSWQTAGLNDLIFTGISSLNWAFDKSGTNGNDFSWEKVRKDYLSALTHSNKALRDYYFVNIFYGLGHLLHLLADAGQPAHVRNDAHPIDGLGWAEGLETWSADKEDKFRKYAENPVFPTVDLTVSSNGNPPVVKLFDTDQYTGANPSASLNQGLAEYTNALFASDDTILTENLDPTDKHYFPYPRFSDISGYSMEILGGGIKKIYLKKEAHGESFNYFASKNIRRT